MHHSATTLLALTALFSSRGAAQSPTTPEARISGGLEDVSSAGSKAIGPQGSKGKDLPTLAGSRASEGQGTGEVGPVGRATGGSGVVQAPAGGAIGLGLHSDCATNLVDQAGGSCDVQASTVPTAGMLYPLGVNLFVEASSGEVGVGTLTPVEALDVQGRVRTTGGIRFGDNTVQTTAQLVGPQGPVGPMGSTGATGPQGPAGPLVAPPQLMSIGTVDLSAIACSGGLAPIYSLTWDVVTGPFELVFEKDFDGCSPALILACNQTTPVSDITVTIGGLTIKLNDVRVTGVEIEELTDALPRENVRLSWASATWTYSAGGVFTSASWDLAMGSGSVTPGVDLNPYFAWFDGDANPATAPAGASVIRSVGFGKDSNGMAAPSLADLRVAKPIDGLTTQFPYVAFAGITLSSLTADLNTEPGGTYAPHMRYELTNPSVTSTSFFLSEAGELLQEISFGYEVISWIYHPGQQDQAGSFWNTATNMGG